ncbi:hypothetical protein HMPREF9120_00611 [Neisseria sp. oral taxon 020 str. F0370]|nr:hypothetical protein HMPREF9120_00611 [Neisseria sp. oral taxon 020 str. F0370]
MQCALNYGKISLIATEDFQTEINGFPILRRVAEKIRLHGIRLYFPVQSCYNF